MRKVISILLLLAMLAVLPVGAMASDYHRITVDGVNYEYNPQITSILFVGVDSIGPLTTTRFNSAPRADSINLVVLDGYHQTIHVLAISRDTMTQVRRYYLDGTIRDEYRTHLGFAYTYGDGGKASCENTVYAVSSLLGGIPIHEYVVTNQSGIAIGNALVGGVTVTVPNNDLVNKHPEMVAGATVELTDENVRDFVQYRDTGIHFSNTGRMQRQKVYMDAYIDKMLAEVKSHPMQLWERIETQTEQLQTSISRSQYLSLAEKVNKASLPDDFYYNLGGENQVGAKHDEVILGEDEILPIILKIFYLER